MSTEQRARSRSAALSSPLPALGEPLWWPDSDDHMPPDTPLRNNAILEFRNSLRKHFGEVQRLLVEGELFLTHARDEVRTRLFHHYAAPDLVVALECSPEDLGAYERWTGAKPLDFALVVVSSPREARFHRDRMQMCERMGIGEYFVFQPDREQPAPRLVGYRLEGAKYRQLGTEQGMSPDARCIRSSALGVSLRPDQEFLRVRDLRTGKDYPWSSALPARLHEELKARRLAEEKAAREAAARMETEARLASLVADACTLAERRAESEKRGRVAAERRAAAAELEISRLKDLIGKIRQNPAGCS